MSSKSGASSTSAIGSGMEPVVAGFKGHVNDVINDVKAIKYALNVYFKHGNQMLDIPSLDNKHGPKFEHPITEREIRSAFKELIPRIRELTFLAKSSTSKRAAAPMSSLTAPIRLRADVSAFFGSQETGSVLGASWVGALTAKTYKTGKHKRVFGKNFNEYPAPGWRVDHVMLFGHRDTPLFQIATSGTLTALFSLLIKKTGPSGKLMSHVKPPAPPKAGKPSKTKLTVDEQNLRKQGLGLRSAWAIPSRFRAQLAELLQVAINLDQAKAKAYLPGSSVAIDTLAAELSKNINDPSIRTDLLKNYVGLPTEKHYIMFNPNAFEFSTLTHLIRACRDVNYKLTSTDYSTLASRLAPLEGVTPQSVEKTPNFAYPYVRDLGATEFGQQETYYVQHAKKKKGAAEGEQPAAMAKLTPDKRMVLKYIAGQHLLAQSTLAKHNYEAGLAAKQAKKANKTAAYK